MKAVLGGKFIILIATIKKFETSHTNNFKVYQKSLKKETENKEKEKEKKKKPHQWGVDAGNNEIQGIQGWNQSVRNKENKQTKKKNWQNRIGSLGFKKIDKSLTELTETPNNRQWRHSENH